MGFKMDSNERKRLEKTQAWFEAIIESSNDAIISKTLDGIITSWNPGAERLFGYTAAEIVGQPMTRLFPPNRMDEELKIIERLKNEERVEHFETVRVAKDGKQLQILATFSPVKDGDGRIIGMSKIAHDITEYKRAEEEIRESKKGLERLVEERTVALRESEDHFQNAFKHAAMGVALVAPDGRWIKVNHAICEMTGYSETELLAKTFQDITHPEDLGKDITQVRRMLSREIQTYQMEKRYLHKSGKIVWVLLGVSLVLDSEGQPSYFISQIQDITERQKQERLALRSQRLESIGTLAGGVAHDLNNALAPIMMSTELLKMQYPKESQIVNNIAASTKRAAEMVRQLLGFARGMEGAQVPLKIDRSVKEIESMIKGSFPKNIELVVQCDAKLPAILGDATQLHQILLNLCVNARDAMPDGGTITLEAQHMDVDVDYAASVLDAKPGSYVVLRVRDTGLGIAPEIIDRIFEPFFTTKGKGTGLGLSTVMGIVKGHGGFLQVNSQLGQGSTFAIYLPVSRTDSDTEYLTKPAAEFRGKGETILFVDDEASVRNVARLVLQRLGFKPLTAIDGADAMIQATQHRTELRALITDLHMPRMDGLNFIQELRRMLPDIPVMATSGRMEERELGELLALNVSVFLDKPFTQGQLTQSLKKLFAAK